MWRSWLTAFSNLLGIHIQWSLLQQPFGLVCLLIPWSQSHQETCRVHLGDEEGTPFSFSKVENVTQMGFWP